MDARVFVKNSLSNRPVCVGASRAQHRANNYAMGPRQEDFDQPVVEVVGTWNEALPRNVSLSYQAGLDDHLSDAQLETWREAWKARKANRHSGALWKFAYIVGTAQKGAVTDPGVNAGTRVYADL